MSTTARKARKRAGIPFTRTPRTATPVADRALPLVPLQNGMHRVSNRALASITRMQKALAE